MNVLNLIALKTNGLYGHINILSVFLKINLIKNIKKSNHKTLYSDNKYFVAFAKKKQKIKNQQKNSMQQKVKHKNYTFLSCEVFYFIFFRVLLCSSASKFTK
jgi:hypothetical protein